MGRVQAVSQRARRIQPQAAPASNATAGTNLPDGRWIVGAGPLVPSAGFYEAVWTFDMLCFLYDDIRLLVVGEGPDRPRLERLIRATVAQRHIHLLGQRDDTAAILGRADVIWVTDHEHGGVETARRAMAAGKPVVASRTPALANIIVDGESGFLVPVGDKVGRGRRTRQLLDDPALARRLGEAARRRVERLP